MEKPNAPVKIIEFDKTTAQLHVRVETEASLISTVDKTKKTGFTKTVLTQTIYKDGIQDLLKTLETQKGKHEEGKTRAQAMLDGEQTALDMINEDLEKIKFVIGDLKFQDAKPEPEPEPPQK